MNNMVLLIQGYDIFLWKKSDGSIINYNEQQENKIYMRYGSDNEQSRKNYCFVSTFADGREWKQRGYRSLTIHVLSLDKLGK